MELQSKVVNYEYPKFMFVKIHLLVVPDEVEHTPVSSPTDAKAALFSRSTLALFDTPATPVGVPVTGWTTLGLE